MEKYNDNGELIAWGYMVPNPNFVERGEYKETELDKYKRTVDFLILSVGTRYEIRFNKPTTLKETRSIKHIYDNSYLVTEKALKDLEKQYTCACDF